jgi:2-amino-4-hydroxy-6-hydroxymethyldihydropteridine diphosphokinase
MNKAYLLTGGNMGHRESNLALAVELIQKDGGKIIAHSALYETAAWGNSDQPGFLNQALLLETRLDAAPLLHLLLLFCLDAKKKQKKSRLQKNG